MNLLQFLTAMQRVHSDYEESIRKATALYAEQIKEVQGKFLEDVQTDNPHPDVVPGDDEWRGYSRRQI